MQRVTQQQWFPRHCITWRAVLRAAYATCVGGAWESGWNQPRGRKSQSTCGHPASLTRRSREHGCPPTGEIVVLSPVDFLCSQNDYCEGQVCQLITEWLIPPSVCWCRAVSLVPPLPSSLPPGLFPSPVPPNWGADADVWGTASWATLLATFNSVGVSLTHTLSSSFNQYCTLTRHRKLLIAQLCNS